MAYANPAPSSPPPGPGSNYAARLSGDHGWALLEGSRFFEGKSMVNETLRKIARRLEELGVPYAVAGGMALFAHGYRRFTEDIDIITTREGLAALQEALIGLGYRPPFTKSKNLVDTETGVRIEFLISGDFPGDGKPKPVAFPVPGERTLTQDGIRYVDLPTLIELKLASGMTGAGRLKDLADVQELIKHFALGKDFAEQLNPYVRAKFEELWTPEEKPE